MFRRCEKNRKNFQAESAMKKHNPELLSNIPRPDETQVATVPSAPVAPSTAEVPATNGTKQHEDEHTSDSGGGDNDLPRPVDY